MTEVRAADLTKEKAELLLSDLKKLMAEVSDIEARYSILQIDYTKMCEDAIAQINAMKAALEEGTEDKRLELEILESEMTIMEAGILLGLVPKEDSCEGVVPALVGLQSVVDKTADYIEIGLDKIGDGMIFPIEKMVNLCTAIFGTVNSKAKKGRYR